MAHGRKVHAQLVGAPGHRFQFDARGVGGSIVRQHAPARLAGFALHRVDHPQRAALPVCGDRQVDLGPGASLRGRHLPGHDGLVALVHLAQFEGAAQAALHFGVAGHQHQARGGLVQPVHDQGFGPALLRAGAQTVLFVRAASGHTQQTGGLGQHQQIVVGVQAFEARRAAALKVRH